MFLCIVDHGERTEMCWSLLDGQQHELVPVPMSTSKAVIVSTVDKDLSLDDTSVSVHGRVSQLCKNLKQSNHKPETETCTL